MVSNSTGKENNSPRLRCYMNQMALEALPDFAAGGKAASLPDQLRAIRGAGYDGVQFVQPVSRADAALCSELGLGMAGSGRISLPADAAPLVERLAGEGHECATAHVGWGMEDDAEAHRLIESVLEASDRHALPVYVETHRATIFQDMWRTVQFIRRFPEIRFNGDFSHWYTGQEMVYGGFENKLAFIEPVLERVRFVHGRIGNPGCIQVNIDDGDVRNHPYVGHFRQMWTASFAGFLRGAKPGESICFVPELLAPRIFYARTFKGPDGNPLEESDRWEQASVLRRIAAECFELAKAEAF